MRRFLTARWQDLIMANYEVDPALLERRVPGGTQLDLDDRRCFISLVGFMFLDTRVMGVPVPFHVDFEEVNLRFYIRRESAGEIRRAVCFIKEIVPRRAIAAVARYAYGEPYEFWRMSHTHTRTEVLYTWSRSGAPNRLGVSVGESLGVPDAGSHGEFIIEHYWGYTDRGLGRVDEYKVEHPKWELFDTTHQVIDVDFAAVYGPEFGFLSSARPYSVLLAKGSPVTVYKGSRLRDLTV